MIFQDFNIHKGYHRIYPDDRYFDVRNDIVNALDAIDIPVKISSS